MLLNSSSIAGQSKPTKRSWRSLWLLLLPLGALAAAGPARLEKAYDTTPGPRINLTNLTGQVVVRGWDKLQVRAVCATASPRVEIDTEAFPRTGPAEKIHFVTHVLDALVTGRDEAADYELQVPAGSSLEIRNRQGSVRVENMQGDVSVESVGATISVANVAGHLAVRSVGGDIEIIRPSGRVEVNSITGNLRFLAPTSSDLRASTTSGRITYDGDFVAGGDYILSAYSGDMDILCPPSASFELSAKTVKGKVDNAFPLTPNRHSASPLSSAHSLLGTHSTGKATVELTSFSGTIRIRRQP